MEIEIFLTCDQNYWKSRVEKSLSSENLVCKIGSGMFKNKVQYQIKWLGFTEDYNEWKYEDEMDCDDLVLAFANQYK